MPDSKPAGQQDTRSVTPVVDPGLPPETRDQVARTIQPAGDGPGEVVGGCGVMLSIAGVIAVIVLHLAAGLSWWWMLAVGGFFAVSVTLGGVLDRRPVAAGDIRVVQATDLDDPSRQLMLRAQRAIRVMLEPRDYADSSLDEVITEATLRRHEWEIAASLREISKLRAEHGGGDDAPGPMTAAVLDTQHRALALATDSVTSRISKLELCAAELERADAADRDWRAAVKASGRNDQYLDLVARTAADEHAIVEISDLAEHASAAVQVFREHLGQASLAAQALVLPPAADDDG